MWTNAFLDIMRQGGYAFMIPLLLLSVVSLAVMLERCYALGRRTLLVEADERRVMDLVARRDLDGLSGLLAPRRSLVALLLTDAIGVMGASKGTMTMERALEHSSDRHMDRLNARLWILRAISHVAPIIGLLGTVVGLAISFRNIGEIGLTQQSVASGIAMALITTIAGLFIALPTLLAEYCIKAWAEALYRRMRGLLHDIAIGYGQ